jgi:predicted RNase H-like HicB family nuclease
MSGSDNFRNPLDPLGRCPYNDNDVIIRIFAMGKIDIAKDAFNTQQTSQIVGATARQISHWDQQGIVKPSIGSASGRGSRRLYSYMDLLALKTVKSLRDADVSLQKVRKCVSYLRKNIPDISHPLNVCTLVAAGDTVFIALDEQTLVDTVRMPGQTAYRNFIDIAELDRQLRGAVLQLVRKRIENVDVGDMTYQVEIEPDVECGGYVATVAALPGCITEGESLDEILDMAADAIECWLEANDQLATRGKAVPVKQPRTRKRA